jgi:hypothetical protein
MSPPGGAAKVLGHRAAGGRAALGGGSGRSNRPVGSGDHGASRLGGSGLPRCTSVKRTCKDFI